MRRFKRKLKLKCTSWQRSCRRFGALSFLRQRCLCCLRCCSNFAARSADAINHEPFVARRLLSSSLTIVCRCKERPAQKSVARARRASLFLFLFLFRLPKPEAAKRAKSPLFAPPMWSLNLRGRRVEWSRCAELRISAPPAQLCPHTNNSLPHEKKTEQNRNASASL